MSGFCIAAGGVKRLIDVCLSVERLTAGDFAKLNGCKAEILIGAVRIRLT